MGWVQNAAAGFKIRSFRGLKGFLRVPEHHNVYSAMTLGYPALELHSVPFRETRVTWLSDESSSA